MTKHHCHKRHDNHRHCKKKVCHLCAKHLNVKCKLHVCGDTKLNENLDVCGEICAPSIKTDNLTVKETLITKDLTVSGIPEFPDDSIPSVILQNGQNYIPYNEESLKKFHGWWANVNRGMIGGLQTTRTACVDAYIFIDTTVNPIEIRTMGGNGIDIRFPNPNFEDGGVNLYTQIDDTTLAHIFNDDLEPGQYWHLKLQNDINYLLVSDSGIIDYKNVIQAASVRFSTASAHLFRRVDPNNMPVATMPSYNDADYRFIDYTQPTNLARYFFNTLLYHLASLHPTFNSDFIGFYKAKKRFDEYLTTGVTLSFNINKIRITKNASGLTSVYYNLLSGSDPNNGMITLGSTVTLAGFGDGWAGVNGVYVNGVSVHGCYGVPNPRNSHLDFAPDADPCGYLGHFYLNLDSSALPAYAAATQTFSPKWDAVGVARSGPHWGGGIATVSVTHKITDDMEYPAFMAAVYSLYYDIFKVMCHMSADHFVLSESDRFLPATWSDLKTGLAANTAKSNRNVFARISGIIPSRAYIGPVSAGFYAFSPPQTNPGFPGYNFNDPYGYFPIAASVFDYVTPRNYIVGARNLYWSLAGVPTKPIHSLAGIIGYPNQDGNFNGGAYFVGTTAPTDFANPAAGNPDPTKWLPIGIGFGTDFAITQHYFGFFNPTYTPGEKIAYIRLGSTAGLDPFEFINTAIFEPPGAVTARGGLETGMKVYVEMMQYLMTSHPSGPGLTGLVIDNRSNIGGSESPLYLIASMIGAKRHLSDGLMMIWRDNENRDPASLVSTGFVSFGNVTGLIDAYYEFIDPGLTESLYGSNSVFKNGKVIILNDNAAISGGDNTPKYFLGAANDKNLGAGVTVKFIGDADSRLHGSRFSDGFAWPLQRFSERLNDITGEPVSGLNGLIGDMVPKQSSFNSLPLSLQNSLTAMDLAPSLSGLAGGAPLANEFEELIYLDFGLMGVPHPDAPLPGWPGPNPPNPADNTTWRDRWLEQSILSI